ncbi:hypothetical protein BH11MYX4_BH11MYX4_36950 [soil metagenome]
MGRKIDAGDAPILHQLAAAFGLVVGGCATTPEAPATPETAPPTAPATTASTGTADGGVDGASGSTKQGTPALPTLTATRLATLLGLHAFTANGAVQPRGRPTTTYFESGPTKAYGNCTPVAALPPRLAAHYHESWDGSAGGWQAGMDGQSLRQIASGGISGGFVRYETPGDVDNNHSDGIGANQLVQYMYPSDWRGADVEVAAWSAGDPDLRGARVSGWVRGNAWQRRSSEMVFWLQSTPSVAASYAYETARWSNWAFTGFNLTDHMLSGAWERFDYRLVNDSSRWTYAGNYLADERDTYVYLPLDQALGHLNGDLFHMLVFADYLVQPQGSVDFDEVDFAYRNKSLVFPSNGGQLVGAPAGGDDPARLTDGWRNGTGRQWRSAASPQGPLEITYALAHPVSVEAVQIHQNPDWPSREVEVLVSSDGVTYASLAQGTVPDVASGGPNFAFFLDTAELRDSAIALGFELAPWLRAQVTHVKVRITSGYQREHWGLGEIELFGPGAVMQTDDDWYDVNADVVGLTPGQTVHYRLVAESDLGVTYGDDQTFTVPATAVPDVITGAASRVASSTAKLEGRINPLGTSSMFWFEYSADTSYGMTTEPTYGGLQITPRTVTAQVEELTPGTTYHYRLVVENETGRSTGAAAAFIAK